MRRPTGRGDSLEVAPAPALPLFLAPTSPASPALTAQDHARLGRQQQAVLAATVGRGWRTLASIAQEAGAPEASASARLRSARTMGYRVQRRRVGNLYEYRVEERLP